MDMESQSHSSRIGDPKENRERSLSFDITSLGPLDDLISLGSHETGSPLVPRNVYNPSNAVHMEIQENAKLPTFNLPVDRSNSTQSRTSHLNLAPCTSHDLDEMVRLTEKDLNLTEMFLKSHDRSSMNLNWSSAGALLSHIGECVDPEGSKPDSVSSSGAAGQRSSPLHAAAKPPVPLSVSIPSSPPSNRMSEGPVMSPGALTGTPGTPASQQTFPLYPYHRALPLPIPKRLSPETTQAAVGNASSTDTTKPTDDAMSAALATAAAIALQTPVPTASTSVAKTQSHPAMLPPASAHPLQQVPHGKQTTRPPATRTAAPAPTPARKYPPPSANPPTYHHTMNQLLPAHAPPGSIMEATKQRSQFGFGGNHVVPSVPLPPAKLKSAPPLGRVPPPPPKTNSGIAYERKKQRAKDARVKLNESIERLAIAISLTGTQSKQRATQLQSVPARSAQAASCRTNTINILDECGRIVKDAKKWDRPSFVGTAASLIQSLNAQCEALMSEMLEMKRQESESSVASVAIVSNGSGAESADMSISGLSPSSLQNGPSSTLPKRKEIASLEPNGESNAKRPRLEGALTNGVAWSRSLVDSPMRIDHVLTKTPVLDSVLSMLDTRSLITCTEVSKHWAVLFRNDKVWMDRSVDRYGVYNVRQWKEKMEDDHLPACSPLKLYRDMDSANVKPYNKHEGSLLLGEARMPGKVSAWATMVERSNGETSRSVLRETDAGSYSSLPVVELRLLIQNTGQAEYPIVVKEQTITVDASTRRRGEEMKEIHWDGRFKKAVWSLDGSVHPPVERKDRNDVLGELCRLKLYESVILVAHIHARGCSTTSKFLQKSNFTKILVTLNGTTVPLVIPFFRESNNS